MAIFAILVVVFLPNMNAYFTDMQLDRPLILRLSVAPETPYFLFGVLVIAGGLCFFYRRSIRGVVFRYFEGYYVSDILWTLSLLLSSGCSLKEGLAAISFPPSHALHQKYAVLCQKIADSGQFTSAFSSQFTLSPLNEALLRSGEKTGVLSEKMGDIAVLLDEHFEVRAGRVISVIQPVLLMGVGIVMLVK